MKRFGFKMKGGRRGGARPQSRRRFRLRRGEGGGVPLKALVPNLVTSVAACAGITSISLSSEGRFHEAQIAILIACVCDGIDGRIARLLKASSRLGAELDSLADFVNFGVAPALFMYYWLTGGPAHAGFENSPYVIRAALGCSLFYAMCDCFRLARFNTMLEETPLPYWKNYFTGVPAPGGCWMLLTPYLLLTTLEAEKNFPAAHAFFSSPAFGMAMLLFTGMLMASRLPTISLKAVHVSKSAQRPVVAGGLLLVGCLFANLWLTLGVIGALYILSVPVSAAMFAKTKNDYEKKTEKDVSQ
ncbi:MAG: phosphatidylcholine/phosphatidylserine synthase [Kiritimatiellae bacterium]|nr:phosphatidylcholine/phosphatidylserine synthase [Kiritimatiellia bacterium]